MLLTRRHLLRAIALSAAVAPLQPEIFAESAGVATLTLNADAKGSTIPIEFTGLSYESAQLANPAFFSAENKKLIEVFRDLSPSGSLRLGGGSSEFTTYSDGDPTGFAPFEVFGPDTSKTVKKGTVTTAFALHNLRAFLDATGWSCIYGLNLGQGTKENAAAEAAAVHRILGRRLTALQIGNEPDSFRNRYRPASYSPGDFLKEWNTFHEAIVSVAPGVRFAGPDISNKQAYLTAFAGQASQHADIALLTGHYYAMGPAGSPDATLDQLLTPEPRLATMKAHDFVEVLAAIRTARLPFRISEGNSCWDGGKPGVSDTLASALWCADFMLRCAELGFAGVNLHGGGNGYYTPIAGAPSTGFTKRLEYLGMQFAQQLAGATMLPSTLAGASPQLSAYAFEKLHERSLVVINKSDTPTTVSLREGTRLAGQAIILTGPALDSKSQPVLNHIKVARSSTLNVEPRSATLWRL